MKKKYTESLVSVLLLILLFVSSGLLINHFYKKEMVNQQQEYLEKKVQLLINQLDFSPEGVSDLKNNANIIASFLEPGTERVTLMDKDGVIYYDTLDENLSGSRNNRPEVQAVLNGANIGSSLRKSDTWNQELLYVAVPVKQANKRIGVVRISETTASFSETAKAFRQTIILLLSFLLTIIGGMTLFLIRQKNRPIETVLPVLKKMASDPQKVETIMQSSYQWEELYQAINDLGEQMSQTYQAFTSTEEQFQTLLEELPIGVFIIDGTGNLELMNPKMRRHLGVGDFSSQQPYVTYLKDPQLIALIHQLNSEEPLIHAEVQLHYPTEQTLDMTLRLIDNHDHSNTIMGIAYDVTHLRQMEQMQKDFVGNVSHELKTPVTSLLGFTETLLDGAKEDPQVLTEFLEIMHGDALRLQQLIQEIILLSKTGKAGDFNEETIILRPFITKILQSYKGLIEEKKLFLTVEGKPEVSYLTKVEYFQPIIKNLIENAIQYAPEESQIIISYTLADELLFKVKDNGMGIAKEDQQRIFERFYRVDKARSRHSGGTGLGLAIVQEYVATLGGSIELESYPQVGSIFTVRLPIETFNRNL